MDFEEALHHRNNHLNEFFKSSKDYRLCFQYWNNPVSWNMQTPDTVWYTCTGKMLVGKITSVYQDNFKFTWQEKKCTAMDIHCIFSYRKKIKTRQINASYNSLAWKNKLFFLSRPSNARIHRNITLKISKCTNIIKNMWKLQGRVGSELSACATYIYIYISIDRYTSYICFKNKQKRPLYDLDFNNVKKIYGNIKWTSSLLGFVSHWLAFSTENSSVVYQSKGPATFKVCGRLVLNEIWSDRCWKKINYLRKMLHKSFTELWERKNSHDYLLCSE